MHQERSSAGGGHNGEGSNKAYQVPEHSYSLSISLTGGGEKY
jgi:hypothetical protein